MYVWDEKTETWVDTDPNTDTTSPSILDIFSGGLKGLQALLGGTSSLGKLGQVLATGGIGTLLNQMGGSGSGPAGYRGGIPAYTATRTQTPFAEQRPSTATTPYRPGQGGITYFNPIQYTYLGKDLSTPIAGTLAPAPTPTPTPTPAPDNTTDPANKYASGGSTSLENQIAQEFARYDAMQGGQGYADGGATREDVLSAYANTPGAVANPDEAAINYWMDAGLGNFQNVVNQVNAARTPPPPPIIPGEPPSIPQPEIGTPIDTYMPPTKPFPGIDVNRGDKLYERPIEYTSPGFPDQRSAPLSAMAMEAQGAQTAGAAPSAEDIVRQAYGTIGRTDIDPEGLAYWKGLLTGPNAVSQDEFNKRFYGSVSDVIAKPSAASARIANDVTNYLYSNPNAGVTMPTVDRAQVQRAFQVIPGANPYPTAADLAHYQKVGIGQLIKDVRGINASNPALARQIAAKREALGLPNVNVVNNTVRPDLPIDITGRRFAAGGRFLKGPGDGVSDDIPAQFAGSGRPARLADGEFVIDARTVSEIGNGSSEAGARKLYEMMDRVHKARRKAKRGEPSGADKYLPK